MTGKYLLDLLRHNITIAITPDEKCERVAFLFEDMDTGKKQPAVLLKEEITAETIEAVIHEVAKRMAESL